MTSIAERMAFIAGANDRNGVRHSVQRTGKMQVAATLEVSVPAPAEQVFSFVTAEDVLPKVLTGYGLLPAVVRTSGNTGPWDQPGSVRTVHLADGSSAREEVLDYQSGQYFAYRTSDYTFALRHLANCAEGRWWFASDERGTRVRWTYTFYAKGWVTSILLAIFVRTEWLGYMRTCIRHVQDQFRG